MKIKNEVLYKLLLTLYKMSYTELINSAEGNELQYETVTYFVQADELSPRCILPRSEPCRCRAPHHSVLLSCKKEYRNHCKEKSANLL